MKLLQDKKGFTLIELLVAITIIGIISMFAIASFGNSQQKARDAQRKSDLHQLATALEHYYNDYGKYPPNASTFETVIAPYMQKGVVVKDPKDNTPYFYYPVFGGDSYGDSYRLYAKLENCNDPQVIDKTTCAEVEYNYTVTSPDLKTVSYAVLAPLPLSAGGPTLTPTPTTTPTPTPTPTPAPVVTAVDSDGDTFQAGPAGVTCPNSLLCDCYDLNVTAKPGQVNHYNVKRGTSLLGRDSGGNTWDSYDYNCDGVETKLSSINCLTNISSIACTTTRPLGNSGFVSAIPSCGVSGLWRYCDGRNSISCSGCGGGSSSTCSAGCLSGSLFGCTPITSISWSTRDLNQSMRCN